MQQQTTKSYYDTERKWYAIDASGGNLGRIATQIAILLQGKHKAQYTPHTDLGDYVVVYNCSQIACNSTDKIYYRHSGRIGSLKQRTFQEQMAVSPEKVMQLAVKRMLKRGPLGNKQLTKLKCYKAEHPHEAQMPKEIILHTGKQLAEVVYDNANSE
jgi:large subunit ribosomal protein L13